MTNQSQIFNLEPIQNAKVMFAPFPHLVAHGVISGEYIKSLDQDYPSIKKSGFLPLERLSTQGIFKQITDEMLGAELASVLTEKLKIELRDKPCMITVRRWSELGDGRIHNDGEAKIVTSLLYLNDKWPENEDGGRFRVLKSDKSFDDVQTEVPPSFGTFVAFVRTENSWHGHKPFEGERRVVQATWLKNQAEYERKSKRGNLTFFLKKLFSKTH